MKLVARAVVVALLAYAAWVIYEYEYRDPLADRVIRRCEQKVAEKRVPSVRACLAEIFPWARP